MKKKQPNTRHGRAAIYARYSSHNQREASIEQQVKACRELAVRLGLDVVETYEDKAISGKSDRRPSFQHLLRDAEKGYFDCVLAWKSNRMGRNMLQAMTNEARLKDWGVRTFYAEEDFDDTAAGRFALRNMMNVNQFYSENMAEDITRGMMDNASKCLSNGALPLGYKAGENGRIVLDKAQAAVVQEIYTRVACREPFVDIAADLNRRGIKTKRGGPWTKSSFYTICRNERYRGIYIYDDVRVEGGVPRIVSDGLFYRVQEVLKVKKTPQSARHHTGAEDYLLTGKLFCGKCGRPMTGVSGTSRSGEMHYYYTCQKRRREHACDKKNVIREQIEKSVAQAIKQYMLTDEMIQHMADATVFDWGGKWSTKIKAPAVPRRVFLFWCFVSCRGVEQGGGTAVPARWPMRNADAVRSSSSVESLSLYQWFARCLNALRTARRRREYRGRPVRPGGRLCSCARRCRDRTGKSCGGSSSRTGPARCRNR